MFLIIGPSIEALADFRQDRSIGVVDRVKQLSAMPAGRVYESEQLGDVIDFWRRHELYRDDACLYTPIVAEEGGDGSMAKLVPDEKWLPADEKQRDAAKKVWRTHEFNFGRLTNPSQQADNYAMVRMELHGRYRPVICSVYYPDEKSKEAGQVIMRPEWINLTEHDKRQLRATDASMKAVEKTDVDDFTGSKDPVQKPAESNIIMLGDKTRK